MAYTQDEYGVVSNSPDTYRAAAEELRNSGAVWLGWTDNAMSHMDVLLVLAPTKVGPSNRLDNIHPKLFVSVVGCGSFGFSVFGPELHPEYLAGKLRMIPSLTTIRLADLMNGVLAELRGAP